MKQSLWECYHNRDEYPYEVWYKTPKQKNTKGKYFHSIEEIKAWCRSHKNCTIEAASWQVFAVREGMV